MAPGVSILRPLKGVDCNLRENLASSFRQDYPNFEIIFSVASPEDPAIQVVHELKKQFPKVDATLIIGETKMGVNPKVNNLIQSFNEAKYDIIWILDSNISVEPDCLGRSVDCLCQPRVGLVHHVPIGVRPHGFGPLLERAFLNSAHAKMYLAINKASISSCVVGKSNMFRRSSLAHVGGLTFFGKFMSEDNIIGQTIWNQNLRHVISADVAYQPLGEGSLSEYFKRRARWTRIRKYTVVGATMVEPFTESIVNGLLAAYGFHKFFGVPAFGFMILHLILWYIGDVSLVSILDPSSVQDIGRFTTAWLVREITALPVYLYACAGSTVEWRGSLFILKNDGTVEQAPSHLDTKVIKQSSQGDQVREPGGPSGWGNSGQVLNRVIGGKGHVHGKSD
ncbi:hypothetical protein HDU76_007057 [Blyttiomyces sp. JEL0837]|nr:hypothetical protein HDU76_007057 [Blyttiomyces sp. JEL0837]